MTRPGSQTRAAEAAAPATATQRLQFSGAELAVIYQLMLGDQWPGNHVLEDLGAKPADLEQARRRLEARALLLPAQGQAAPVLNPTAGSLFNTVMYPLILGTLQLSQGQQPIRNVNVSWSTGWTVLNTLDAAGHHYLEPLASPEAVADALLRECGLSEQGTPGSAAANGPLTATSPEAVADKASLRALFLVTTGPGGPDEQAEAVSWLLSEGQLWLIAQHDAATAAMNRTSVAELRDLLRAFAQRAAAVMTALGQPDQV
jgi:hypothetical protein